MIDISKYRGLVSVAVGVAVAVAGALNAPEVAAALKNAGVSADQAITAAVALVAAVNVVIGAVSNKVQPKDVAAVAAVRAAVLHDDANAAVVKQAVVSARAEAQADAGK